MMKRFNDKELEKLLGDLESERVERKQSFNGDAPKKVRQAVCAFANDLTGCNEPGVVFIGVKDNGTSMEIEITDQLLLTLSDMRSDGNILPLPVISVETRVLKGSAMAVITVMPSDMPPVRYDGRIWIRTGPRRAIANEQEERILNEKRRHKNLPFDIFPVPSAKISDLSKLIFENEYLPQAFAEDVLEANGRTYEERLASCRMINSPTEQIPTVLGLLSIGTSPQDFLSGAYIQFLRIDGIELADPVIDEQEIRGTMVEMLRQAEDKLKSHNRTSVDIISTPTHQKNMMYPLAAIQQILYNAVLHRTYENTNAPVRVYWFNDRIEISSPGGPYGNVTVRNFGTPGITDYRNPNIADMLKTFGFVQTFGRGIATAKKQMEQNGNPPPEFKTNEGTVLCILRNK